MLPGIFCGLISIPIIYASACAIPAPGTVHTGRDGRVVVTEHSYPQNEIGRAALSARTVASNPMLAQSVETTREEVVAPNPEEQRQIEFLIGSLTARANTLSDEIKKIDDELSRCKRMNTGWKAATIVGGIGTIGSAAGIVGQLVKQKQREKQDKAE